jgi:glycosyltransferase involved in cell wall biosynthesis
VLHVPEKKKLLVNVPLTNLFPDRLTIEEVSTSATGLGFIAELARAYRRVDCVLIVNGGAAHAAAALLAGIGGKSPKVLFYDVLLKRPGSLKERALALVKRFLFRHVDVFLVVHRDTSAYGRFFGIRESKCRYLPFKANNFEILDQIKVSDAGYILAGGASYRDYECFIEAVRTIDFPVRIVLPATVTAAYHHTAELPAPLPGHVTVIRHDGNRESWNALLAAATIVVVPIIASCIQPAGISVYLEAMALGKPVVISRGPATNGLIGEDMTGLYEPGRADDLERQIRRMLESPEYRRGIAEKGRDYALGLEGSMRVSRDLQAAALAVS